MKRTERITEALRLLDEAEDAVRKFERPSGAEDFEACRVRERQRACAEAVRAVRVAQLGSDILCYFPELFAKTEGQLATALARVKQLESERPMVPA